MAVSAEVAGWWSVLGGACGRVVAASRLSGGSSGSAMYRVVAARGEFVLKVGALGRELRFYRELAHRVPVRVPALVGWAARSSGVALLLEAAGVAARPPYRWVELATELGALHRSLPPAAVGWAAGSDVAAADPAVAGSAATGSAVAGSAATGSAGVGPAVAVAADVGSAGAVSAGVDLAGVDLAGVGPAVAGSAVAVAADVGWAALGRSPPPVDVERLDAALAELPLVTCHGDWHLGNLLHDSARRWVWIDWPEVGPGRGPEDLAFLWQRAEATGLSPPRAAMLTAYAWARGIPADAVLRRATVAAELKLLLLDWPPHLARLPPPARERLIRRMDRLTRAWARGP